MADGHRFLVTSEARPGDSRRLRIPARDVSVCRERPGDTSILNVLPVRLDGLRDLSTAHCLLRLRCASSRSWLASPSARAGN
jgi:molybdate transport system ATP-binding protein